MAPPIKTTIEDIDALFAYLKGQIGWVPLDKVRKTIDSKYADNRKLEACRFLGLLERDGTNVKLSDQGRLYADGDPVVQVSVMQGAVRSVPLYFQTLEWIHHGKRAEPTRTEVGNYWHDKHQDLLDGAKNAGLTDAVIFFFRVAGAAGLGKFISAGNNRPTALLRADLEAVATFVTGAAPAACLVPLVDPRLDLVVPPAPTVTLPAVVTPPTTLPPAVILKTSPAIHINLEIHIAADATPDTVEEIFKNMRKYVLDDGE